MHNIKPKQILNLLTALFVLSTNVVFGQSQTGSLKGTVTTSDGSPVPGVLVSMNEAQLLGSRTTVTGENGHFHIMNISPGDYQLSFNLEGFSTVEYPNVVISVNKTSVIDVEFDLDFDDAEDPNNPDDDGSLPATDQESIWEEPDELVY